ncbi:restriction endonuclease subunit S [Vagococcus fluvialis]|uniref:restriction endonuclease subunit S n=1 Tax=Vagococcus fluvialis TaxID=2738 RepID=UPI003B5BC2F9
MMSKNIPQLRFEGFTYDWEQRKLGEYVIDYVEKTTVQNQFPVLTSSQKQGIVLQEKYFTNRQVTTDNNIGYYVLPKGYFTFRSRSDNDIFVFNRNDIIDKGIISYFYPVFTLKKADSNFFLKRINNGIQRQLSIQAEGTGQHVLSLKKFKSIVTMFPSIEEQQKIGLLFKQLDETITLQERKLDLLKEQKKGYLQKMFPKNGAKVPELRFAGFADDWEERKLGDYIIQYSEKTKQNNQYPVFTSSRNGLFFQKDYYKGNQIASEDNTGYNIVPRGYFTYRHMSDDLVFKFNINDLADYGIVSTLYPVFTTNEQLDSKYLQYQLNEGSEFRRFSLLQKQGGSRTYMYLNKLQNMILTIPKLEEQQKIGSFFKQLDDTIALHQRKLDLLKEQKKGFLQKMFI